MPEQEDVVGAWFQIQAESKPARDWTVVAETETLEQAVEQFVAIKATTDVEVMRVVEVRTRCEFRRE